MTSSSQFDSVNLGDSHHDPSRRPYIHSRELLTDEFIAGFQNREPNWGPFGKITYLRSYSQHLPHLMRYERWHETVRRVVEFSFALYKGPASPAQLRAEAEELYALIWNLKGFPAGRTLWVGGTPSSYTYASAAQNFNCAFCDIKELNDYAQMVLLLMGGSGVGFRVTQDNVAELGRVAPFSVDSHYPDVNITPYQYVGEPGTVESTSVTYGWAAHNGPTRNMLWTAHITVGDSREGWAQFVELYLHHLTVNPQKVSQINVNVNALRPLGSELKTFGGYASGPEPIQEFAVYAHGVLAGEFDGKPFIWTDLKMLDISNLIGRMVVAGGTRRSAQIALGDSPEFAAAKTGDWWAKTPWRSQSNNSVMFHDTQPPSAETLQHYFAQIMQYGEPGLINANAAGKRRPEFRGLNPCAEILLGDSGVCNLTTPVWSAFIESDDYTGQFLDVKRLMRALYLLTRHNLRITNVDMSRTLPEWHERQQKERLLGVSFTGFGDTVDLLDMNEREQRELFIKFRDHVHQTAEKYASEMGVPVPLLMTTVKPEGCWSMEYLRTLDEGLVFMDELDPNITQRLQGMEHGFKALSETATKSWHAQGHAVSKTFAATPVPLQNITLANGRVLRVTPWHPLSINGKWKQASELEIGDIIDARYGTYRGLNSVRLHDFTDMAQFRSDARDYFTPEYMNPEMAYLVGAYWANGSFTTNNRIKYHQRDLDVHEQLQRIWREQFGVDTTIIRSKDRDSYVQDMGSVKLAHWFVQNGLAKDKSSTLERIPYAIRTSNAECILAFIAGYADGEGCFSRGSFCIDSVAEPFMRHLQEVGEAVGVVFGLSINNARANSFGKQPIFKLHMSRMKTTAEALERINLYSVKARSRPLEATTRQFSYEPTEVVQVFTEAEATPTYDIEVEGTHAYYQGGLYSHNTLSTLAGVSSGLHAPYAPKYLRRVRVARVSAVADAMRRAGFVPEPEFGEPDLATAKTWVFTFPVSTPAKRSAHEYTAVEQLERYKLIQTNWTDHNSSITVYIAQEEVAEVIAWLRQNWDSYVAVSFLPKSNTVYPLMPFESVDDLPEMQGNIVDVEAYLDLITLQGGVISDDLESCAGGACPVR